MKFTTIASLTLSASLAFAELGLREYANDFNFGFAINSTYWEGVAEYTEIAEANFNLAVAENACKFAGIQAEQGVYDFTDCDKHLEKATELGMNFRGHCLIWHGYQPLWFMKLKGEELRNAIVDHITTVLTHYRGKFNTWDIVNEALDDGSTGENGGWTLRNTFLSREVPDFIDVAFKTAREVDPDLKLFYNDYNIEGSAKNMNKTRSAYNFIKDLVDRGVPIDGVGLQYHLRTNKYPSYETVTELMASYAKLGLEVQITEMDVSCENDSPEEYAIQAEVFGIGLRACLDSPNCSAFLLWGFGDKLSWKDDKYALIFDADLKPKPAYYTLLDILKEYNAKKVEDVDSDDEDIQVDAEVVNDEDSGSDEE